MNRIRTILWGCFLTLLALGGAGTISAQDEPQQPPDSQPKPAARSLPGIDTDQDNNPNQNNQMEPDDTPLTGVLSATLGTPEAQHSYWLAGLQYGASVQSSGYGNSDWFVYNYFAGNFSLLEAWSRSKLALNYTGGAFVSSGSGSNSGAYQQLSFSQSFDFNRWKFQIHDSFSYTPQSGYGFGGGTNLGTAGVGGSLSPGIPGIGNGLTPNASLYAGLGPQYYNVGVIQGTYALSTHSSITASAGYGILNFIDPGYVGTDSLFAGLGYNYALSPKDTIGVLYQFSSYHFPGDPQAFGSQVASLAYSRKITGRIALSLYGGPQFTSFRVPIGTSTNELGGYASAFLTYKLERGTLGISYVHGLSGGGGLLVGSIFDQVTFSASRKLTRLWNGNVNFGYAHNRNVIGSSTPGSENYSSWYAGGGVSRPFGRSVSFAVAYTASISTYNLTGCPGTTCGPSSNSLYQTVTASVQWRTRPFVLH
jgi:hypothetical protein